MEVVNVGRADALAVAGAAYRLKPLGLGPRVWVACPAQRSRAKHDSTSTALGRLFQSSLAQLIDAQLGSGEIPLCWDASPDLCTPKRVKTVFPSAFVGALLVDIPCPQLQALIARALDFLERERNPNWTWSFFGAESGFPADIDDTFLALAALRGRYGVGTVADVARRHLRRLKSEDGLLITYFEKTSSGADPTVNANVLLSLSLLGIRDGVFRQLARRLIEGVRRREHSSRSSYYVTQLPMLVSLSLAAKRASASLFRPVREAVLGAAMDCIRGSRLGRLEAIQMLALLGILRAELPTASPLLEAQHSVAGNRCAWFRRRSQPVWYASHATTTVYAALASVSDRRRDEGRKVP